MSEIGCIASTANCTGSLTTSSKDKNKGFLVGY